MSRVQLPPPRPVLWPLRSAGAAGRRGLNRLVRSRVLRGPLALHWARHHIEEIGNLEHFLPQLHAEMTDA